MSREDHVESVEVARNRIREVQGAVHHVGEVMDYCMGAVVEAVGETNTQESAQNVLGRGNDIRDKLSEIQAMLHVMDSELIRYGGGF